MAHDSRAPSPSRPVPRVAVVGCGYWGKNLIRNFHALGALEGLQDESRNHAETFLESYPEARIFASFDEVLADGKVEGVVLATPAELHHSMARRALEAGKDVFVEKPLALSEGHGQELVELARERGRILMVGHLLWYHPAVLKLAELIRSGELGQIRHVYSHRLNFGKLRREENVLWSFAPHDLSVILGLLGEMPESVEAGGGNFLQESVADVSVSLLKFPSGVRAHVFVSWLHPFKEQKLVVVGEKQMAVFDDVSKDEKLVLYPHSVDWQDRVPVARKADGVVVPLEEGEPLRSECQHFLDRLVDRERPRTDGEEGLRVLRVLGACQEALTSAGPVELRESPDPLYHAHESAFIDEGVEIGAGTRIWHVSHVLTGSKIGKNCNIGQNVVIGPRAVVGNGVKIQNNVSVYERVILEDEVFCGPSMVFTNVINPRSSIVRKSEYRETIVRRGATLGANSTILCGITIGQHAFVAAGAVVTRSVPDHALVVGNPARITGWMCTCGIKLEWRETAEGDFAECSCGEVYRRDDDGVTRQEPDDTADEAPVSRSGRPARADRT